MQISGWLVKQEIQVSFRSAGLLVKQDIYVSYRSARLLVTQEIYVSCRSQGGWLNRRSMFHVDLRVVG